MEVSRWGSGVNPDTESGDGVANQRIGLSALSAFKT